MGVFIGSAAPSVQTAVFLAPISSVPMMLFCGFFIVLDSIKPWLRWLQYFSYFRYSFVALAMAVFDDMSFDCGSLGTVVGETSECVVCARNPHTNITQRVVP
ncbi:ABC transporter permease, partial [Cylindrospermopsis raciborskii]|uniref:ABC transporter permease n=1 Tax=Cylindrospermopsis raciborskii TaxID=77022 RepID=UPI0022C15C15